jgi:hypothetical protein
MYIKGKTGEGTVLHIPTYLGAGTQFPYNTQQNNTEHCNTKY